MPFFSNDLGIDLGTANTLVYVRDQGIIIDEPSIVVLDKSSKEILKVGWEAKEMLGRTPGEVEAVSPVKDGVIVDFIVEDMLRHFIKKAQKKTRHLFNPRAVIGVPSGINDIEKKAVVESAENAGIREVNIVAEPMASAIGIGIPVSEPSGNMIVDIGGGTTEIAVIAFSGMVSGISIKKGGDAMDKAIAAYLKKKHNLLIGYSTAEKLKIHIGSAFPLKKEMTMPIKGRDLRAGIPKTIEVSSEEVRLALNEPISVIVDSVKQALEETPPELSSDILDKGIVLTGGCAQLKGIDERLRQETNLPVNVIDNPMECVARGTVEIMKNMKSYKTVLMNKYKRNAG